MFKSNQDHNDNPYRHAINWKTIHKNTVIQHALQHWARGGKSDHKKAHEIWAKAKRHRILDEDSDLLNLTRSRSRYQIKPNSEGVAALYIGDVEWEPVEVECGSDSSDDDDEEGRLATAARGVPPTVPQDTAQENHQAAADQVFGNAVAAILPAANGGGLSGLTTLSIAPVYAPQNHTHILCSDQARAITGVMPHQSQLKCHVLGQILIGSGEFIHPPGALEEFFDVDSNQRGRQQTNRAHD